MPDSDEVPLPVEPSRTAGEPSRKPADPRLPRASTTAVVIRESDRMRTGIDAAVLGIAMDSLTLRTLGTFAVEELLKIRLKNIVQRFEKETRGVVRQSDTNVDGSTTVRVELLSRLSALEVSMLKMGIASGEAGAGPKWV
jgi:hypothetical protein